MPKVKISEFSSTPANNTDIDSINIAEGCAPSGINDAIRELMAQLKDFQTGAQGDSFNGPIGTSTAAAGAFTTLTASSTATLNTLVSSGATLTGGSINGMAIGGTTTAAGAFTTLAASGAVTLSGGTANGVAYLNGSKVLTSGSALTFSGSALSVTGSIASTTGVTNTNTNSTLNSNLSAVSDVVRTDVLSYGSTDSSTLFGTTRASYSVLLSQSGNGMMLGTFNSTPVIFGVNNAEVGRFTSTGLGIGTSSPAVKLDVVGVVRGTFNSSNIGGATSHGFEFRNSTTTTKALVGGVDSSAGAYIQSVNFGTNYTDLTLQPNGGNLGLGVTPSAWTSVAKVFEVGSTGSFSNSGANDTAISDNRYFNGTNNIYKTTNPATIYSLASGQHRWFTAASGTAGDAITFTQAATLDASGNYMVGTTSSSGVLSNTTKIVGGSFTTRQTATASLANLATEDITGLISGAAYMVVCRGDSNTTTFVIHTVYVNGSGGITLATLSNGNGFVLTSPSNNTLRVTGLVTTQTYTYSLTRIF